MSNEPIVATSLDDLAPPVMEITIPRPDGRLVTVKLRALSEGEVWKIRQSIVWPKPPISNYKAGGVPVYAYQDANYLKELSNGNKTLATKAILAGLQLDIPGENEEERLAALESKLGNYAFQLLVEASNRLNLVGEEEIAAVAASFRPEGTPYTSPTKGAGLDAGPVAEPATG